MAKSKIKTVKASRNGVEKEFSVDQWNSMKKNNALYGWRAKSDLPDEVIDKDKELENSKIAELQKQLDDSKAENEALKTSSQAEIEGLTKANAELQKQLDDLKTPADAKEAPKADEPAKKK